MTSKIKVDNIENQCGGAVVTKCGGTTTISGSVVKSNAIQASDGGNLVSQCGTTITLGASGDTINLASGASQSGFGRTGTVDWDTTPKTATFSAVSGNGYFVNTTAGVITVNLPAGSAGAIVGISDYASTFQTNNITITPNGAEKINGVNDDAILSTQGIAVSLVYVDSTRGWKSVTGSDNDTTGVVPLPFVTATGGTITTSGDFKIHTFTGPGTFCVSEAGTPLGSNTVDYLVVAGGGSGGGRYGGGGGGGGYRESPGTASGCYSVSPLGTSPAVALSVPATSYPITVGAGGAAVPAIPGSNAGNVGSVSTFSSITSAGGGGGGGQGNNGLAGGNGGGGSYNGSGGAGNTPPVSPAQGVAGGNGHSPNGPYATGGGGGATEAGQNAVPSPSTAGRGGAGATSCISASPVGRSGGGGGSGEDASGPSVIAGGGSPCGSGTSGAGSISPASNAAANRGGGSGAAYFTNGSPTPAQGNSGVGGSGIVIIRYKFQ